MAHVDFAATAADVTDVVVDGSDVVRAGRDTSLDMGAELESAIVAAAGSLVPSA